MRKKIISQRLISLILTFSMILGIVPIVSLPVMANDNIEIKPSLTNNLVTPITGAIGADFTALEMPIAREEYSGFIAQIEPIPGDIPEEDIVHIKTAADLAAIGGVNSEGKYYVLDNDIDLVDEWVPINDFRGTLDGQGYSVNNLYILENSQRQYAGLFGNISRGITIKNIAVNVGEQGLCTYGISGSTYAGGWLLISRPS